jgi:hypothetical protein
LIVSSAAAHAIGMRVVRETAREHALVEVLRDALVHDHRADRRVARREAL